MVKLLMMKEGVSTIHATTNEFLRGISSSGKGQVSLADTIRKIIKVTPIQEELS